MQQSSKQANRLGQLANKQRMALADGLRGIAALWVVLFHLSEGKHIEFIKANTTDFVYSILFAHGDLGVAVFFVLSRFVMALTVRNVDIDLLSAVKFTTRRFIRLAPPYYFAILFALALIYVKGIFLGGDQLPFGVRDVLAHLLFLQEIASVPHINTVFWTLCVELQFYIAFAITFFIADGIGKRTGRRYMRQIIVVVMAIFALLWPFNLVATTYWPGGFIQYWYSFLAGVLCYWASQEAGKTRRFTLGYLLTLALASVLIGSGFTLIVALTAGLLMYAGIRNKMSDWLAFPSVQFIGLVSYSLYLLHNPLTGAISWVVHRLTPAGMVSDCVTLFLTIAICLFVSWLAFLIVERPSIQWSHMISLKKKEEI